MKNENDETFFSSLLEMTESEPKNENGGTAGQNESASEAGVVQATEKKPSREQKPRFPAAKEAAEWMELLAFSVAVVILIFSFFCRIAVVDGPSMEQTLYDGQILMVSDLFYEPKQGDVIVFQSPTILGNKAIVKRVIAVGGQTVDIDFDTWTVTVDGVPLEEEYVNYMKQISMDRESRLSYPLTVEEGKLFVMGDNRNNSTDSRSVLIGQVDERFVLGRVLFRLFPLSSFGTIR
ncbi:MAG: signal peptidase I [Clostridia bacterium]|nr:signal peptidase I [Clostridia bacterium]